MNKRILSLSRIIILSLACFAIATAAGPQAKNYDNLLGTWDVQTEDGAYQFVFEFTLDGGKLAGQYTGSSGTVVPMEKLAFENNVLSFTVNVSGMVIDYTATVVEDQLAGTLSLEYGQANFTGKKRKK